MQSRLRRPAPQMPKRTQSPALAMQPEHKASRRVPSAGPCSGGDIWRCPKLLVTTAAVDLKKVDFVVGLHVDDNDAFATSTPIVPRSASRTIDGCPRDPSDLDSGYFGEQQSSCRSGLSLSPLSPSSSAIVGSAALAADAVDGALDECCRRDAGFSQQSFLSQEEGHVAAGDDAVASSDSHDDDDGYGTGCAARLASTQSPPAACQSSLALSLPPPLLLMLPPACRRPDLALVSDLTGATTQSPVGSDAKLFLSKLNEFLGGVDPERVIGRRVGVEQVDVVSELARLGVPCLGLIARHLSADDKLRCCMVSRSWRRVFHTLLPSVPTELQAQSDKENGARPNKSSAAVDCTDACLTSAPRRMCLATVQLSTEPLPRQQQHQQTVPALADPIACVVGTAPSLHQRFVEEAKSLRCGEKLAHCPRCRHPAKLNETTERGTCRRVGCLFDYCTRCFADYHRASPCLMQQQQHSRPLDPAKSTAIGSQRSKRNLRRL